MTKQKVKKALVTTASACMLVGVSVLGTMAYLTSTQTVTNTFTSGKVAITMDEADVDLMGQVPEGSELASLARVKTNEYKLIPGSKYIKDPTIHVDTDSEDCYLYVTVENGIANIEDSTVDNIAKQMENNGWKALTGYNGVYYYGDANGAIVENAGEDRVVFEKFTITGDNIENAPADEDDRVTGIHYIEDYITETDDSGEIVDDAVIININAYGVQQEGFSTPEAAWAATFAKAQNRG